MLKIKALHKDGFYVDIHEINFQKQIVLASHVEDFGSYAVNVHLRCFDLLIIQEDNNHPTHIPLINQEGK